MKQINGNPQGARNYLIEPRRFGEPCEQKHRGDIDFTGQLSMTKQSEADACDINKIVKRYEATGLLPETDKQPYYGDFSTMETFLEAQNIVAQGNSAFSALNATIRARFDNDPAKFLQFCEEGFSNPLVAQELVKMGIATERKEEVPAETPAPRKTVKDKASAASKAKDDAE